MADFRDAPPTDINPYEVLGIEPTATQREVRRAYMELALRYHPDKSHPDDRDTAHVRFQEIACAYAILSDERRRNRYDTTGNTAESLDIDDGFNWNDFFRTQWAEAVTGERLDNLKLRFQNSEEEKRDVLNAYRSYKGKLNSIFDAVMHSNTLDDEDRFRGYIDQAIADGDVEAYDAYVHEAKEVREKRIRRAKKESKEAMKHSKALGVHGKKAKVDGAAKPDLAALLQHRQNDRAARQAAFLEGLEAKHAGGKNGKKRKVVDEPSEEAFEKAAERLKKPKRKAAVIKKNEQEDQKDIDLEKDSPAEEESSEDKKDIHLDQESSTEEPVAPKRRKTPKPSKRPKKRR
ncbi:hypothetical protein MMC07_008907 [Pseudocyphellaria aurata]|nr:hypothetical protein [Pseudocyphellaria aurata]